MTTEKRLSQIRNQILRGQYYPEKDMYVRYFLKYVGDKHDQEGWARLEDDYWSDQRLYRAGDSNNE